MWVGGERGGSDTMAESTLYTIRVVVGWGWCWRSGEGGGRFHISNISSATIFPPHSGLMHPSQLILSHDRDLKYTTGSGSSDSLLCSISRLELNGVRERVKQKEIDKRER